MRAGLHWPVIVLQVSPDEQFEVPEQLPAAQTSPLVHATPSSQAALLFVYWQVLPTQALSVQGLPSLQSAAVVQGPSASASDEPMATGGERP
jgi:hypothetical protein